MIAAFCLTEAQAGSDSFNIKTKAHRDVDYYILNGEKLWITNGGIADVLSVFARTEKGITAFVVKSKWEGITLGQAEKKMGIRGSATNPITFENVKVPFENMIGQEGRVFYLQ